MPRVLSEVLDQHARIVAGNNTEATRLACEGDESRQINSDLFFFMTNILGRSDMKNQWVLERCDEVDSHPNGYLDLWPRFHFKSSIHMGKALLDALTDPESPIAIFSHTRPAAKQFLAQIKRELETNALIKHLWPDVVWDEPQRESAMWSLDGGLILKRRGNPKEGNFEAHGVVDGQPTGRHFHICIWDDLVTKDNAYTPEMREKTLKSFEMSLNLGIGAKTKRRLVGTRYHFEDAYAEIARRGTVKERVHQAEINGQPVYMSREELDAVKRDLGPVTYASQMMLNPKAHGSIGFEKEWWRTWHGKVRSPNRYILVDPANDKKKKSDFTTIWVVDLCPDQNYYVRAVLRDKLNLAERIALIMNWHKEWAPVKAVAYEQYGMQADIQAIKMAQNNEGYRFPITPVGGPLV